MLKSRSGRAFCRLLAVLALVLVPAEGTGEQQKVEIRFTASDYVATERGAGAVVSVALDQQKCERRISFGAPAYVATEGNNVAQVSITLDRAAADDLLIPLVTKPARGNFSAPERVSLAKDERTAIAFVLASADDNFANEAVELSFGDLPARVCKGAQKTTTVALVDALGTACIDSGKAWCTAFGMGMTFDNAVEYKTSTDDRLALAFDNNRRPVGLGGFLFPDVLGRLSWFVAAGIGGGAEKVDERLTIGLAFRLTDYLQLALGGGFRRVRTPRPDFVRATNEHFFKAGLLDDETRFDNFDPKKNDADGNRLFTGDDPLVDSTDLVYFVGLVVPVGLFGQ